MFLENYNMAVQKALKGCKIGDKIKVINQGKEYEGMLMPRTGLGDGSCIVIKLDNGYNIGIKYDSTVKIQRLKQSKTTELGKRKEIKKLEFDEDKPGISIISTGGTIAARVEYKTGGVLPGLMKSEELLQNVPELKNITNIKYFLSPCAIASEDICYEEWQKIANICAKEINKKDIEGVIITHGTDFLHYTAAALSFMLKELNKPVVVVGAQRSSDRGSSDAGFNLICAAHAAVSDIAEVGICMHSTSSDNYCLFSRGTKVRKMHTSRRDAFRPINDLPLAKIWPDGKIEIVNKNYRKKNKNIVHADTSFERKIALIKTYPGADPLILTALADKGYKGFIIEGSGLGHVPSQCKHSWIPKIKQLIKKEIPVCVASQTIYGRVNPDVYTNLRLLFHEAGAIPLEDMLAETAFVKLGWVLGHTKKLDKIKEMMLTNIAGEISKRSLPETFLY